MRPTISPRTAVLEAVSGSGTRPATGCEATHCQPGTHDQPVKIDRSGFSSQAAAHSGPAARHFPAAVLALLLASLPLGYAGAQPAASNAHQARPPLLGASRSEGRLRIVSLSSPAPLLFPGEPATVTLVVQNTGAVALTDVQAALTAPEGVSVVKAPAPVTLAPGATQSLEWEIAAGSPGRRPVSIVVTAPQARAEVAFLVITAPAPPVDLRENRSPQVLALEDGGTLLRNRHFAVLITGGDAPGTMLVYRAARPAEPHALLIGVVPALALTLPGEEAVPPAAWQPARTAIGKHSVTFAGDLTSSPASLQLSLDETPRLRWSWRSRARASVLPLYSMLTGSQVSMLPGALFSTGAAQAVDPDPADVTVPLMAAAGIEGVLGQLWLPAAGSAPRSYLETPAGEKPGVMSLSTESHLEGAILFRRDERRVTSALREWEKLALDENYSAAAPAAGSASRARSLAVKALTEDLWKEKGWVVSPDQPANRAIPDPAVELLLRQELSRNPNAGSAITTVVEAARSARPATFPVDLNLAYRTGPLAGALAAHRAQAHRLAQMMGARGNFIQPAQGVERGLFYHALNLLPVARLAALTGEADLAGATLRGLAYLQQEFTTPARSATLLDEPTPALTAALSASESFLYGYILTGDGSYLEQARYWADAATAFVYAWSGPDELRRSGAARPTFAGAAAVTIASEPVISSHLAAVTAGYLYRLDRLRDDDYYETVAGRLLAYAISQQAAEGDQAGLLHAVRGARTGARYPSSQSPHTLLAAIQEAEALSPVVSAARVSTGPDRLFVASGATIARRDSSSTRLRLDLAAPRQSSGYITIAGVVDRPLRVTLENGGSRLLPEVTQEAPEGWVYYPDASLLVIKVKNRRRVEEVEVRWEDPRRRRIVDRVDLRQPAP